MEIHEISPNGSSMFLMKATKERITSLNVNGAVTLPFYANYVYIAIKSTERENVNEDISFNYYLLIIS